MRAVACFIAAALACAPATALAQIEAPSEGIEQSKGIEQELLSNPDTANQILDMQDDPTVKSILNDPETMRAVRAGDLDALLANPKIRAMMADPRVKNMGQNLK
jgi:hypothetical protein